MGDTHEINNGPVDPSIDGKIKLLNVSDPKYAFRSLTHEESEFLKFLNELYTDDERGEYYCEIEERKRSLGI